MVVMVAMSSDTSISNSPRNDGYHPKSPNSLMTDEQKMSVMASIKSVNAPLLPSHTTSHRSDAATIVASDEKTKPVSLSDHERLMLLSQVVRILDDKVVYYRNRQSIWVYVSDELRSLKKMVFHPIESMFRGRYWNGVLCWQSEIKNFIVGSFCVTGVISDEGSHGLVVTCTDHHNRLYAMKIERCRREMSADVVAFAEIALHPTMLSRNNLHIPRLRQIFSQYGKEVVVMECLGPDLRELSHPDNPFSVKTVLQVAISLLTAYEQIHKTGWLHLTPKPVNFCIGGTSQTKHKIYVVDFGRAQQYLECDDHWNSYHRKFKQHAGESPQAVPFQSVWGEKEQTTSRRDDMMSLSLALLALAGYWSPWESRNTGLDRGKWIRSLGWGLEGTMVKVLDEMLVYSSKMKYEEEPAYEKWRERIREFARAQGIVLDDKFDWDDMICEDDNGRIVLKKSWTTEKRNKKKKRQSKMSKRKLSQKRRREQKKAKKATEAIKEVASTTDGSDSSSTKSSSWMSPELEASLERGRCEIQ